MTEAELNMHSQIRRLLAQAKGIDRLVNLAIDAAVEAEREAIFDAVRNRQIKWVAEAKREDIEGNLGQKHYLQNKAAGALGIMNIINGRGKQ